MIRAAAALWLALAGPVLAQDEQSATTPPVEAAIGTGAVLRGLDKINGKTEDLELRNNQSRAVFGLQVDLVECRYPVDNPTGDAYAYLVIREKGDPTIRFQGWMIASSPALNALDHFRYDVWVLRCITS